MAASLRKVLAAAAALGLSLGFGTACKRPETAVRERTVQRVELVQKVQGMTPEETQAVVAQLREGLGVAGEPPDPAEGPIRVFRLTLRGQPNPEAEWGLGKTWLVSTGEGGLLGALAPTVAAPPWVTWQAVAIGAGAGTLLGAGFGPVRFHRNEILVRELGYLPWRFTADWEVLDCGPGALEVRVATSYPHGPFLLGGSRTHLELRPHLRPLPPESRTEADVRRASLRAYVDALVKHFQPKG